MADLDQFPADLPIYRQLGGTAAQRRWLAALPALVAELKRRWRVRTGPPYRGGTSSWAAPGTAPDGRPVVLKVAWPHPEARDESAGLRLWDGAGAVRVYRADPPRYALLLERCEPGTALVGAGLPAPAGLRAGAAVLGELWSRPVPAGHPFQRVGPVTAGWAAQLRQRYDRYRPPFDAGLVEHGARLLEALPGTATREVLVHGDANPGNVLAATRRPWLAIDAKPMVGDPGYDPAPLLCQLADPFAAADPVRELRVRAGLLADLLGEPADRLLAWAVARAVEGGLWQISRGEPAAGADDLVRAAVLARAAGW